MSTAPEAMIKLFFLADREGGCFLAVKWAQRLIVAPGLFQREFAVDNIDDVDPIEEVVYKGLWDPPGHSISKSSARLDSAANVLIGATRN